MKFLQYTNKTDLQAIAKAARINLPGGGWFSCGGVSKATKEGIVQTRCGFVSIPMNGWVSVDKTGAVTTHKHHPDKYLP